MSETIPFHNALLDRIDFASEPGHARRDRASSGALVCDLTTIEPLCIHSVFKSLTDEDKPWIPGSSLRGMLRNTFEFLGASCLRLMEHAPPGTPRELRPCDPGKPCIACRTFGFVDGDISFAGKILVTDAKATKHRWVHCDLFRPYSGPPVQSDAWAIFPKSGTPIATATQPNRRSSRCAAPESVFRFRIDYVNLAKLELSLLLFAITLNDGQTRLCHKLGYAKAIGLGACTLDIKNQKIPVMDSAALSPFLATDAFRTLQRLRRLP